MDILQHLRNEADIVNAHLDHLLPSGEGLAATVIEAMRYSTQAGGKRIRAAMVRAAAQTFGAPKEHVLPTACGIEMIHAATLIHDDLPCIDDGDLRRGKPSCHRVFGEATALLAGDALLIAGLRAIATQSPPFGPERVAGTVAEVADLAGIGGVIAGEAVDIEAEGQPPDPDTLAFIHDRKTAALFRAAVRAGAILAGAPESGLQALTEYATALGLAFQVTDDILDVVGDPEATGKQTGTDAEKGKLTYPAVWGLEGARTRAEELAEDARGAAARLPANGDFWSTLVDFVVAREY
ncbi:MAG: polyprenyl synthetase family protein [Armatimonadota bacterium]